MNRSGRIGFRFVALIALVAAGLAALCTGPGFAADRSRDDVRVAPVVRAAILANDLSSFTALVEAEKLGPDVRFEEWREKYPTTMLGMAMVARNLPVAKYLLDEGASTDLRSTAFTYEGPSRTPVSGETYSPLMLAASTGFVDGAKLLVAKGADVNLADDGGCTALIIAAAFDEAGVGRVLLEAKADPEQSLDGTRCLTQFPMINVKAPQRDAVKSLPETKGATPLWIAAATGAANMVKLLLEAGADRSATASCGNVTAAALREKHCTPERIAELRGRKAVAALFSGAEKAAAGGGEAQARDVRTLTEVELSERLKDIMKRKDAAGLQACIDRGLRVNDLLLGEDTPLTMACAAGAPELVKMLLDNGANPGLPLVLAQRSDYFGDRLKMGCEYQWNALLTAIARNCEECVRLLIAAGVDPNRMKGTQCVVGRGEENGMQDFSPLALAARGRNPGLVKRLIDAGAEIDAPVRSTAPGEDALADKATPLWIAAYTGNAEIVRLLLEAGADADAKAYCGAHPRADGQWCTVRRIAELQERRDIVELIDGGGPAAR
jgi:ankyrin repeat protein